LVKFFRIDLISQEKSMDKGSSEIAKLTERISKDPKSKLFVPLAEEYKKAGDLEMAVHVLLEGLEHNPGYVTAKTFLGRLLMEKGDLSGAQKEFEEVVKAVPDNLLAQRKLGDLYALQDNRSEALKHYKNALALNPGDKDFASFVSDVESGVDVRPRLQQQKAKPSSEPSNKPEERPFSQPKDQAAAPAPPSVHEEVTASETMTAPAPEFKSEPELLPQRDEAVSEPAPEMSESSGALEPDKTPEPAQAIKEFASQSMPFAMPLEHEEAEEVLYVEPLDDELPETSPEPEAAGVQSIDQSDDFTTNTLADLYVAQGFFEKAIDIYERMYADHPNRGLKDKLDRVKAMSEAAAASVAPEGAATAALDETTGSNVISEREELVSPGERETEEIIIDAEVLAEPEEAKPAAMQAGESEEQNIFTEPGEYGPTGEAPAEETQSISEEMAVDEKSLDISLPPSARETARGKPLYTDFEPQEYVPQDAELHEVTKEMVHAAPKRPAATRQETIERLENWLKNIVKEK